MPGRWGDHRDMPGSVEYDADQGPLRAFLGEEPEDEEPCAADSVALVADLGHDAPAIACRELEGLDCVRAGPVHDATS